MSNVTVNRNAKDSVFVDLFREKKYQLELYQFLHPEDKDVTEDQVETVTLDHVLSRGIYNDFGMMVKNRTIILLEAQSTWSENILIRAFLYISKTYQNYINDNQLDIFQSKRLDIPVSEIYVVYTGNRKDKPESLSLSKLFFSGRENALDINVKVLYGEKDGNDILSQYVGFAKVFDEQVKLHGSTEYAIKETIRICSDKDILKEYLLKKEREVIDMLITLFDEETIRKNREATIKREAHAEGKAEGLAEGESKLAALLSKLISQNRIADIEKASSDSSYREKLYEEFSL